MRPDLRSPRALPVGTSLGGRSTLCQRLTLAAPHQNVQLPRAGLRQHAPRCHRTFRRSTNRAFDISAAFLPVDNLNRRNVDLGISIHSDRVAV
jgi:hypothetical protein